MRYRTFVWPVVGILVATGALAGCIKRDSVETGPTTALHEAAAEGRLSSVEQLLRDGADVDARDETGKTALHHAAANGHGGTVGALLDGGANPAFVDLSGLTPRHYAEQNGHSGTASKLPEDAVRPDGQAIRRLNPSLAYPDEDAFAAAIGAPAHLLTSEHVYLFAPKARAREAAIVFPYLVQAYDALYDIVGQHTEYIIAVYNFPEGHADAFGGTSNCVIYYDDKNLRLDDHAEWREHGVPHVSGYIEEMAHNFVAGTQAQFGWEMVGWSIGVQATESVAGNPIFARHLEETRARQAETFARYVAGGYVFPADIPGNLVDRLHAHILGQCERTYGEAFWPDFFREIAAASDALREAARQHDGDTLRNARYAITVNCFDRLPGIHFKQRLAEAHISAEIDVKSMRPTEPGWNRRLM